MPPVEPGTDERPSFERTTDFAINERRVPNTNPAATLAQVETALEPRLRSTIGQDLRLGDFQLGNETTRRVGDKWFINYELRYKGQIPLSPRSYADVVVGVQQGDIRTLRARNVPAAGVDGETATVTEAQAIAAARAESAKSLAMPDDSPVLQHTRPILAFEAGRSESERAQLCWLITVSLNDPVRAHRVAYSIKAIGEPVVVYRENLVKDDHQGTVHGSWWDGTPVQPAINGPLPYAWVTRTAPNAAASADASGAYRFAGTGQANVTGALRSDYFRVLNYSGSGNLIATATGNATAPINLAFAAANEYEIAQSSAFFWAHRARAFAGGVLTSNDLKATQLLANLNDTCNASFEPASPAILRLYRGGPSTEVTGRTCVNRAYADTIFHEYGHGVDWVLKGYTDKSYAEGFSDAMAILFTRSNCYGRDAYQNAQGQSYCLRPASNALVWPGKKLNIHQRGSIYSGFVLELVTELKQSLTDDAAYALATTLTFQAAAENPSDIKQAVYRTLLADDNDGKLTNLTPHFVEIKKAALKKGIWDPAWP